MIPEILICGSLYYLLQSLNFCRVYFYPVNMIDVLAPITPITKYHDDVCSICLDDLKNVTTRKTLCGHYFCRKCIEEWLSISVNMKCPNCNYNLESFSEV
jgi:rubrerythrin